MMSKLRRVLPTRANKGGSRPTMMEEGIRGPGTNDEELWSFPRNVQLTEKKKRMFLASVVAIGMWTVFRTHVYTFAGHILSSNFRATER